MLPTIVHLALFLTTLVGAQTPSSGFTPITDSSLLAYSNPANISLEPPSKLVAPSGESDGSNRVRELTRIQDVAYSPSLYLPSGYSYANPYIGIQVDANIGALHWIQPNLVAQSDGNLTVNSSVQGSSDVECPYLEPEPPAGGGPHRYVILLFEQPANWTVSANYSLINPPVTVYDRLNFSLPDFISSSGLGGPIGATFFRAMNGTAQQSSIAVTATVGNSAAPASGTPASTTTSGIGSAPLSTYTGGAAPMADPMVGMAMAIAGGFAFVL